MRIVMTLLVRDEADIVRSNIDYHLAQGVDYIVATDNGSVDGTVEILREFERAGCLRLIYEPGDDYSQDIWVTRMARLASIEYAADWVINNDADEFWWPLEGTLRTALDSVSAEYGVVRAPRSNFVPTENEEGAFYERMTFREINSVNALGESLPPKVLHRADPDVAVAQGNHSAQSPSLGPTDPGVAIMIFHFPLRTYRQFENKIRLGGAAYERNSRIDPQLGAAWRRLFELFKEGRLREHYDAQIFHVDDLMGQRDLVEDTRLRDYLRAKNS